MFASISNENDAETTSRERKRVQKFLKQNMDALTNLNKSVALCDGRDKYFKLAQNSARLVHFILTKLVVDPKKQIVISMALMDTAVGSGRQLMRFFKEFREFQVLMGQLSAKKFDFLAALEIARTFSWFSYFVNDHFVFLLNTKILPASPRFDIAQIRSRANQYWFCANLIGASLRIRRIYLDISRQKELSKLIKTGGVQQNLVDLERERNELRKARFMQYVNLTRDLCELHISATMAEMIGLRNDGWNRGLVAWHGIVSATLAIYADWGL